MLNLLGKDIFRKDSQITSQCMARSVHACLALMQKHRLCLQLFTGLEVWLIVLCRQGYRSGHFMGLTQHSIA